MKSRLLDYASPAPPPFDEDAEDLTAPTNLRRLGRIALVCGGTLFALTCWCIAGARWGQRVEGSNVLDSYVTGTNWYSHLLIQYPVLLSLLVLAAVAVFILVNVLRLRWSPGFLLVIFLMPAVWLGWVAMMFFTIWDDISP